jgi:hypothetical protein
MTQSLIINTKEYIQSNVLALRCGYSSDYIGKLAREEKILGTQIGRQWFIEPESLNTFLLQTEIAKKIRAEELRKQRKAEHGVHRQNNRGGQGAFISEFEALSQAVIIVACGLLVGSLGWTVSSERLGAHELHVGLQETISFMARSLSPNAETPLETHVLVAASAESVSAKSELLADPVFTTLPEFPLREVIVASSSKVFERAQVFSDEVRIIPREDGSEVIVPVFKNGGQQENSFLIIPVNAQNE